MTYVNRNYIHVFAILIVIACFLLSSCEEEGVSGNLPPTGLAITEIQHISPYRVTISFTNAVDLEGDSLWYELYLDDKLIVVKEASEFLPPPSATDQTVYYYFSLWDLLHSSLHTGKIVVKDNQGNQSYVEFEFTTAVPGPVFNRDLVITTQREIDIFPYTDIKGTLTLKGEDIRDISNLSRLGNVETRISIQGTSLRSLNGLEKVYLNEIEQHKGLRENGREIDIVDNPKLQSIVAFQNINRVRFLTITNNDSLTNLDNFYTLNEFWGTFWYEDTHQTKLEIIDNERLENIDGFANVFRLRNTRIVIENNKTLSNLDGFMNGLLTNKRDNFMYSSVNFCSIKSNPNLTDLCGIKGFLENPDWRYEFRIDDNGYNPTENEIKDGNCSQ